jgi:hypothetical protein
MRSLGAPVNRHLQYGTLPTISINGADKLASCLMNSLPSRPSQPTSPSFHLETTTPPSPQLLFLSKSAEIMGTTTIQTRQPFVFYMSPGAILRGIPLFTAAFFLSSGLYLVWGLGLGRLSMMLRRDPGAWFVMVILLGGTAFMIRLAFPPRRAQARLEARGDRITFVPRGMERVMGDPATEVAITSKSSAVLICLDRYDKLFDGYRVIVHSPEEPERPMKVMFMTTLDTRKRRKISDGITAATSLPVRFVIRRRATDESVTESPWNPPDRAGRARVAASLAIAITPIATGVIAGRFDLRGTGVIAAALVWLAQTLAIVCYSMISLKRSRSSNSLGSTLASTLPTIFIFGAWYGLAYVMARLLWSSGN